MKIRTRLSAGAEPLTDKHYYVADPVLGTTYVCGYRYGQRECELVAPSMTQANV